ILTMFDTSADAPPRKLAPTRPPLLPYAVVALVPALGMLYIKFCMIQYGGLRLVASALNRVPQQTNTWEVDKNALFSVWEKISFFRADLLVGFIFLPALMILLAQLLSQRWRPLVLATISAILTFLLFSELQTYSILGR